MRSWLSNGEFLHLHLRDVVLCSHAHCCLVLWHHHEFVRGSKLCPIVRHRLTTWTSVQHSTVSTPIIPMILLVGVWSPAQCHWQLYFNSIGRVLSIPFTVRLAGRAEPQWHRYGYCTTGPSIPYCTVTVCSPTHDGKIQNGSSTQNKNSSLHQSPFIIHYLIRLQTHHDK
jgi:hypothetical protein